jgi:anti-sigma B factor antagonist
MSEGEHTTPPSPAAAPSAHARLELQGFAVRLRPERDAVYVMPAGELDIATVDQLEAQVRELSDAGFQRVVVDLRELTFIDLSGVRLLCELDATARAAGWELELIQGCASIRRLLVLTETLALLPFTTTTPARVRRSTYEALSNS